MPAGKTCCDSGLPAACCNTRSNFDIITNGDAKGTYDTGSIMHYRTNAFAKPGLLTLVRMTLKLD